MFTQIMSVVQKSNLDIADLRQECNDLRQANANLERYIRETNLQNGLKPPFGTPTAPPSPQLRAQARSPFFGPTPIYVPSPLGDRALSSYPFKLRELPGFWAVVPAGGAGTRLWPLSREGCPKFLLDLTLRGRSLIQATWDRLLPLAGPARLMVVTGRVHSQAVRDQLPDMLPSNLLAEPSPKESAAAIGLAAAVLARRDPEAILGSFAADHMISGTDAFMSAVAEAVATARHDLLVTIGIAPSHPATGFGYIRLGESLEIEDAPNARVVSQFKEKPDARTAASYLSTGNYRWNGGMFVVKARFLMELLQEYEPALAEGLQTIAAQWDDEQLREKTLDEVWPTLPKIAIDNAVAEPAAIAGKVAVVPATFGWDDVGDFSSLADLLPAEAGQPRILGDSGLVVTDQSAGGIVVPASGRLVACLGVDDLVVVDTADALLVTTRARSQEVKRLVAKCREAGWKATL
ncbi:mannose-1-phosphate guanylyltransferase [Ramaria rubella]|nr:mannose-1-phosphate guanylyltransferase [Ramaria rubella]